MKESKAYSHKEVEKKWYEFWEVNGFFKTDIHSSKPPFSIIMPPPNITGSLHMGHALGETIQDILIRYKRMRGHEVLFIPGIDHAGISTQTVVERQLFAKYNKKRTEFSREEFLAELWKWKAEKEKDIIDQIKKIGCSTDWSYFRFTMDKESNLAVKKAFKLLYDDGLIYKGYYLVNWDPVTQTAISDDEVEYEERDSFLWYFHYPILGSKEHITISTTRPETMLADTAVAIHPTDPRFSKFKNKKVLLPIVNREIPIIEDIYVKPEFGSGAVKITPAHDFNDYEIGKKHNLEIINILTPEGKLNDTVKEFANLTISEARTKVVEKMKKLKLLEKIEPYQLKVGLSYRSKAPVEPYLSKQWFLKMEPFKKKLIEIIKNGEIKFIPQGWENTYFYWIENIRDWCISRQLWWGHQIPIWYNKKNPELMLCSDEELPLEVKTNPKEWYQDEDVLDTWFSSALWPFSTLGWPQKTIELEKFYPTSILVTGHDIIFFWVARMILMSEYTLKKIPFHKTFLHGLIFGKSYWKENKDGSITYLPYLEKKEYDEGATIPKEIQCKWEKMSKSKGNIIDPIQIIDEFGCDAMRIALASSITNTKQIDLDRRKFEEFKNFANKIYNGTKFIIQNTSSLSPESFSSGLDFSLFTLDDRWILTKVNRTVVEQNNAIENYRFDQAATTPYKFFWDEFCSYYLEIVKSFIYNEKVDIKIKENKQKLLLIVLIDVIRLLHPVAPFITEEMFSILKDLFKKATIEPTAELYTQKTINALKAKSIMFAPFPQLLDKKDIDEQSEQDFSYFQSILRVIRNIRAELKIPIFEKTDIYIYSPNLKKLDFINSNKHIITSLVKINHLNLVSSHPPLFKESSISIMDDIEIAIPLPKDLQAKEHERLLKEKEKLSKEVALLHTKLSDKEFLQKAPKSIVSTFQSNLEKIKKQLEEINSKLDKS